jgi:hypothetical protein
MVEIQRLTLAGLPDGTTIASGTAINALNASAGSPNNAIAVAPPVDLPIDAQFAFILSSSTACTLNNPSATDQYNAGDAYVDAGGGWQSMFSTDGRYDVPSFVTLIQPAKDVAYLLASRGNPTATVLNTGNVLIVGNAITADLYDPATNTSVLTTGSMSIFRSSHAAALLNDGTVLVVGGRDSLGNRLSTAEIYNPATGTFSATNGLMAVARESLTATKLADGRVLVAGGNGSTGSTLQSAEVYDPIAKTFSAVGNMTTTRNSHTATLLASGKVLITGSFNNGSTRTADLFNPATNTVCRHGRLAQRRTNGGSVPRPFRGRALENDGRVLIAGGQPNDGTNAAKSTIRWPTASPPPGTWRHSVRVLRPQRSSTAAS